MYHTTMLVQVIGGRLSLCVFCIKEDVVVVWACACCHSALVVTRIRICARVRQVVGVVEVMKF
jgi:hypothetical protein